jgi:uncharacterized membrane protein
MIILLNTDGYTNNKGGEVMAQRAYFGWSWLASIILAIIPLTNVIFGIVTRIQRDKILLAILNFFLCPLFWIIDLISIILNKDLEWLA